MNILLKAFDGTKYKPMVDAAFRGRTIGTCICITDEYVQPSINAKRFVHMPAKPLRECTYPGVDWSTIAPLDEELVEKMRHCEGLFMPMMDRYARRSDISYAERKRQYMAHLR